MKQLRTFLVLMAATAPVVCAAQAPAASSGTSAPQATGQATAPASPASPQTPAAAPQAAAAAPQAAAPATPAASTTSQTAATGSAKDSAKDQVLVRGYRREVLNGEEHFCKSEAVPGSRAQRREVCYTREELEARQNKSQEFIEQQQRMGGLGVSPMINGGLAPNGGMSGR